MPDGNYNGIIIWATAPSPFRTMLAVSTWMWPHFKWPYYSRGINGLKKRFLMKISDWPRNFQVISFLFLCTAFHAIELDVYFFCISFGGQIPSYDALYGRWSHFQNWRSKLCSWIRLPRSQKTLPRIHCFGSIMTLQLWKMERFSVGERYDRKSALQNKYIHTI